MKQKDRVPLSQLRANVADEANFSYRCHTYSRRRLQATLLGYFVRHHFSLLIQWSADPILSGNGFNKVVKMFTTTNLLLRLGHIIGELGKPGVGARV